MAAVRALQFLPEVMGGLPRALEGRAMRLGERMAFPFASRTSER